MSLYPLQLTATDTNWRLFIERKQDPRFLSFQQRVHERDQYSCQYCGFRSQQAMEVVNLDGNYYHNSLKNLVTACIFCAQCCFLESIGKGGFGGGSFIYLPELSQVQLNILCHTLFAAIAMGNRFAKQARDIYLSLRLRIQIVEDQLGQGFSKPSALGLWMAEAQKNTLESLSESLNGALRILPHLTTFVYTIQQQMESALSELHTDNI